MDHPVVFLLSSQIPYMGLLSPLELYHQKEHRAGESGDMSTCFRYLIKHLGSWASS